MSEVEVILAVAIAYVLLLALVLAALVDGIRKRERERGDR